MSEEINKVPFDPDSAAAEVPTAQDFTDEILSFSLTTSSYAEAFVQNFAFFGKTLEDWSTDLAIIVPDRPDPHELRGLWIQLANHIQTAAHFKATSSAVYNTLASGTKIQKDDLVSTLVKHYASANMPRPAAKVLDAMADSYLKDSTISRESAKLCKDFWTQKYDALVEVRKALEGINMTIITEHKYAGGTEMVD